MAGVRAFPFLRPVADHVQLQRWLLQVDGIDQSLDDALPHWDPAMALQIAALVAIDPGGVAADCRLAPTDHLKLVLTWFSSGTGLRGCGTGIDLRLDSPATVVRLDVYIDGGLLADRLRLEPTLVLATAGQSTERQAPHRPGSRLWSEVRTVLLEGQAARFPIELRDFAAHSWLPARAGWYLEWDPEDLGQTVLGNVRLYVNTGNERVRNAVADPARGEQAILETLRYDLARSWILAALDNEDFVHNPDVYAEGTVGAVTRGLLHAIFPTVSIEGLHVYRRHSPARLDCDLQAALRLFEKE